MQLVVVYPKQMRQCNWFWKIFMNDAHRSGCPINLTLEVVGDKWSLLIIRDIIFGNRRHFRELLTRSEEGIASNILADRLKKLVEEGILSKTMDDPSHNFEGEIDRAAGPVCVVHENLPKPVALSHLFGVDFNQLHKTTS